MNTLNASGKAFSEHWIWAAEKGLMNMNTAKALRAACAQVLAVLDDWETVDVRSLDLDDVFHRFQNKRGRDFIPESLDTYKRRVSAAHRAFLEYLVDPSRWIPPFRERHRHAARAEKRLEKRPAPERIPEDGNTSVPQASHPSLTSARQPTATENPGELIEYPFPLRDGRIARLTLPADLKIADVRRLSAFLASLAMDSEPDMS